MEPAISLRIAAPADAEAIADLHRRSATEGFMHIFPSDHEAPSRRELAEDWLMRLRPDPATDHVVLAAERDDAIVGVIVAGRDPADPAIGRMSRLYIDPKLWNRGVARRASAYTLTSLFHAGLAYLRDLGCTVATGWIMEYNHRARAVFEHLGGTPTGERQPTCEKAASPPTGVVDLGYQIPLAPLKSHPGRLSRS